MSSSTINFSDGTNGSVAGDHKAVEIPVESVGTPTNFTKATRGNRCRGRGKSFSRPGRQGQAERRIRRECDTVIKYGHCAVCKPPLKGKFVEGDRCLQPNCKRHYGFMMTPMTIRYDTHIRAATKHSSLKECTECRGYLVSCCKNPMTEILESRLYRRLACSTCNVVLYEARRHSNLFHDFQIDDIACVCTSPFYCGTHTQGSIHESWHRRPVAMTTLPDTTKLPSFTEVEKVLVNSGYKHKSGRYSVTYGQYSYRYGGAVHEGRKKPQWLEDLELSVKVALGEEGLVVTSRNFSLALVNYYPEGSFIPWHSDNENCIDKSEPILSLSLGNTCEFKTRTVKGTKLGKPITYQLKHLDLVAMRPDMQDGYQHMVSNLKAPRVNVTWRAHKDAKLETEDEPSVFDTPEDSATSSEGSQAAASASSGTGRLDDESEACVSSSCSETAEETESEKDRKIGIDRLLNEVDSVEGDWGDVFSVDTFWSHSGPPTVNEEGFVPGESPCGPLWEHGPENRKIGERHLELKAVRLWLEKHRGMTFEGYGSDASPSESSDNDDDDDDDVPNSAADLAKEEQKKKEHRDQAEKDECRPTPRVVATVGSSKIGVVDDKKEKAKPDLPVGWAQDLNSVMKGHMAGKPKTPAMIAPLRRFGRDWFEKFDHRLTEEEVEQAVARAGEEAICDIRGETRLMAKMHRDAGAISQINSFLRKGNVYGLMIPGWAFLFIVFAFFAFQLSSFVGLCQVLNPPVVGWQTQERGLVWTMARAIDTITFGDFPSKAALRAVATADDDSFPWLVAEFYENIVAAVSIARIRSIVFMNSFIDGEFHDELVQVPDPYRPDFRGVLRWIVDSEYVDIPSPCGIMQNWYYMGIMLCYAVSTTIMFLLGIKKSLETVRNVAGNG